MSKFIPPSLRHLFFGTEDRRKWGKRHLKILAPDVILWSLEISERPQIFFRVLLLIWSWWVLKAFRLFESNPILCERNWDLVSNLMEDLWIWQHLAGFFFQKCDSECCITPDCTGRVRPLKRFPQLAEDSLELDQLKCSRQRCGLERTSLRHLNCLGE